MTPEEKREALQFLVDNWAEGSPQVCGPEIDCAGRTFTFRSGREAHNMATGVDEIVAWLNDLP